MDGTCSTNGLDLTDPVVDSCKHGNEPSGSTNCRVFPDQESYCQLFKNNSAPWN
jgi:hypothetical protein